MRFRQAQADELVARCGNGTATVSDMIAYHRATEWPPNGEFVSDDRAHIEQAYVAVYGGG
jgi:hypothetical protein